MNSSKQLLECAQIVVRLSKKLMHDYSDLPKVDGITDNEKTINLLRSTEWTMGNGQCFICYGHKPRSAWWTETVGHENNCGLAKLLESLGSKPVWVKENKSKASRYMKRWSKKIGSEIRAMQKQK